MRAVELECFKRIHSVHHTHMIEMAALLQPRQAPPAYLRNLVEWFKNHDAYVAKLKEWRDALPDLGQWAKLVLPPAVVSATPTATSA